jgi:VWFA-related protein
VPAAPQFHASTDIVRLEVTVLGRDRQPVRGLAAIDFRVFEDGRERPITVFAPVDLSAPARERTPAWQTHVVNDVASNRTPDEGRLVVIVFDWSIRFQDQANARRIAAAAIDALGPADRAAVLFANAAASSGVPQNFTLDRALLKQAIDQPFAVAETAAPRELGNSNGVKLDDPEGYQSGDCFCRLCSLELLTRVSNVLQQVSNRPKVILFITEYVRTVEALQGTLPPAGSFASAASTSIGGSYSQRAGVCSSPLRDAREALQRSAGAANVTIHVLDPVGVETGENTPLGERGRISERQTLLPVLADLTGGRTVMNTNDVSAAVPAILAETSSYYLIGFVPAAGARRGSHKIEVKTTRKDVSIKARDRYASSDQGPTMPPPSATSGVTSVLPASGIPLDVSVAPYVALDATGGALVVGRLMDDTLHASSTAAQWIASAYTPRGAAVWADRRAVTIGGNHRGTGDGEPTGIVSSLQLQPGRYEVRSSISTQTGDIGSVYAYVDVPDFANDSLALSGLLLNVAGETAQIPDSQLRAALPFAPTTLRELARHTSASAFAQVVEGTKRHDPLHAVAVDASIQDADGHLLWQRQSHVEARAFDARRIAGVTVPLPINELGAGRYLFQLRTSVADRTVTRSLSFEIK